MAEEADVRIVALKCPGCGGALEAPLGTGRTRCEHCGNTVVIIDSGTGKVEAETVKPVSPEEVAAEKRTVRIILWVMAIAIILPIAGTILINIVIAVISIVLAIVTSGAGR